MTALQQQSADDIRKLSEAAREAIAKEAFSLDRVMTLVERYAKAGFREVKIKPPKAVCLHATTTAQATKAALTRLGYSVEWQTELYEKTDRFNPAGVPTLFVSMIVIWEWLKPIRWSCISSNDTVESLASQYNHSSYSEGDNLMPFVEGKTVSGWGVVRFSPWHFAGIFAKKEDAEARARDLGEGYEVKWGENREGSDDFVSVTV
jgi:hypothetical protein